MKKILLTSLFLFTVSGCQSVKTSSTVNPEVNVKAIDSVAVIAVNDISLEYNIVKILESRKVKAYSGKELSAFATSWDEFRDLMHKQGINYLLFVGSNVSGGNSTLVGTNSYTNTTTTINNTSYNSNPYYITPYGASNTWSATSNSNTITTPIYNSTNYATSEATLFNNDGIKVWYATINVDAQGTLYTGHSKMIKGITKGVIKELKKNNLIQ